jgi:phage terminase large subunit GpA-like protein
VRDWVKASKDRDEFGDCTVYAYAALQLLARRYNRATMWDQLEATLSNPQAPRRRPVAPPPMARPGGFVSRW